MDFNNLGWVKAVHKGSTAPDNTDMLWYDTASNSMKYYNTVDSVWLSLKPDSEGLLFHDTFNTVVSQTAYTRPSLSGMTIIAIKMGQYFLDDTNYTFVGTTVTLGDSPDGIYKVTVLYAKP